MRRILISATAAAIGLSLAACGSSGSGGSASPAASASAAACSKASISKMLYAPGVLTVGTDQPAYPPWFVSNNPANGKGYESAVAYAIAKRLDFAKPDVKWIAVPFNLTFRPGPKNFDFAMQQISYSKKRAEAVDFSDSYYDVNQALVALKDKPLANVTSIAELKDEELGLVVGTTSYQYIIDNIRPNKQPLVFDTLDANVAALKNGQIDGLVTDFPSAYYIGNVQLSNAKIVGRFPTIGSQEYFGLTFEKGNPLVGCVNKAIEALRADGTLKQLEQQWITSKAHAPLIKQ